MQIWLGIYGINIQEILPSRDSLVTMKSEESKSRCMLSWREWRLGQSMRMLRLLLKLQLD